MLITRTLATLAFLGIAGLALDSCSSADSVAPALTPSDSTLAHAIRLHVDLTAGTVTPVGAAAPHSASTSLIGADVVAIATSNYARTTLSATRDLVRFDVALVNGVLGTTLTTPAFPAPPAGVTGLLLLPFSTKITAGLATGKINASADWDGPLANFFDTSACLGVNKTCLVYEPFPTGLDGGQTSAPRTVGYQVDKTVTSFDVFLVLAADVAQIPVGTITGTVTSPQHGVLPGVTVSVSPAGLAAPSLSTGAYTIIGVRAAVPQSVSLSNLPDACISPPAQPVTLTSGATSAVPFVVTCRVGTISGQVTSPGLGGLAGATVTAGGATASTDATGKYTLTPILIGTQVLSVSTLPSLCLIGAPTQNVVVVEGQTTTADVNVPCSPGSTLTGTVMTSQTPSVALPGVTVSITGGHQATTDANGMFSIPHVLGSVTLTTPNLSTEKRTCSVGTSPTINVPDGNGVAVQNVVVSCPPPVAVAASQVVANRLASYTLVGSASTATNGAPLTYSWQVNGTVVATTASPVLTAGASISSSPYQLTVNDGVYSTTTSGVLLVLKNAAKAIFVAPSGSDGNAGTMTLPKRTIQSAITAAQAIAGDVYAQTGSYSESLTLATGVSIYGGFTSTWTRDLTSSARTTVSGGSTAVSGLSVSGLTIDGVDVVAADAVFVANQSLAASSQGIALYNSSAITISNGTIRTGAGAAGRNAGAVGANGNPGVAGGGGESNSFCGGGGFPSDHDALGGRGGDPIGENVGGVVYYAGYGGGGGEGIDCHNTSAGTGGGGGTAAKVVNGVEVVTGGGGGPGTGGELGGSGSPGGSGFNGAAGTPGTVSFLSFATTGRAGFIPDVGSTGVFGLPGGGGGGGGASGRSGGGGGGGGGLFGLGGSGGQGGGGSIAVGLYSSSTITVLNLNLTAGNGGAGANSLLGGTGGNGGSGGQGASSAGAGGAGGRGGNGGRGGPGAGGPSVGILAVHTTTLSTTGLTIVVGSGGASGDAGVGTVGPAVTTKIIP